MPLKSFECRECLKEFVMADEDAAAAEDMTCPVCQGEVRDEEEPDEEESA